MKTSLITSGYLKHIRYMYKYQDYVNIHISYTSQSDTFRIFGSAVKSYNHTSCKVKTIIEHLFHAAIPTYIDRNQCVGKIAWSQPKLRVYMQSRSTRRPQDKIPRWLWVQHSARNHISTSTMCTCWTARKMDFSHHGCTFFNMRDFSLCHQEKSLLFVLGESTPWIFVLGFCNPSFIFLQPSFPRNKKKMRQPNTWTFHRKLVTSSLISLPVSFVQISHE